MWRIISWRKAPSGEYAEARRDNDVRYPGIPEKAYQMEKRRKKKRTKEHFNTFIGDSTLHGLHFCFDKKHLIRRIVWTLILLASLVYVGEKIYQSIQQYFDFPMSTTTTIGYEPSLNIPAISVCNNNDFKGSLFHGTALDRRLREISDEKLNGTEYRKIVTMSNHRLVDMLVNCDFNRKKFNTSHFRPYWDNSGTAMCFTFNSGIEAPILSVNRTGPKQSIRMDFNIQHYDYSGTDHAGLKIILHGQDETPIKTAGILLAPGTATYIEIAKRKIYQYDLDPVCHSLAAKRKNLKLPYKTACGSKPLKHFETYSQHLCWLDSLTTYVVERCGCIDAFMPGDYDVCGLDRLINCTWGAWENFDKFHLYNCPLPCEIEEFITKQSYAMYPSNTLADSYAKKYNLTGSKMENRIFIRENFLMFKIFYGELSYELVEQIPSYDLGALLGDIGGQLGLFLGSSLLTYVEFFDCLLMVIYTKYFEVLLPR